MSNGTINIPAKSAMSSIDSDIMLNSNYLRQSASLVNDALQKGFDVLHLSNGDIITTGTKTVIHQYSWDKKNNSLIRTHSETKYNGNPTIAEAGESEKIKELILEDDI